MTAARLIDALVLADFARAIRPEVRPKKDALTGELDDLVSRRQIVEMRVQETLTDRAEIRQLDLAGVG
jgi:hypothetical protein